jgi:hypothetical protein
MCTLLALWVSSCVYRKGKNASRAGTGDLEYTCNNYCRAASSAHDAKLSWILVARLAVSVSS